MTIRKLCRLLLAAALVASVNAGIEDWRPDCITEPVGFGKGTVGGQGGEVFVPKNIQELRNYLTGDTPRIIHLTQTFDFTDSEGKVTEPGCYFNRCGAGFQYALNESGFCSGRQAAQVQVCKAGLQPLNVGSYKTIMGVGGKGVLRGKGLKIRYAKQVIIRDISIVDINPQVVWGGDALAIMGADKVWIHKVTFRNIGRQFIATFPRKNTGITISSCTFDGNTAYAPYCDRHHYWVWLFWGTDEKITLINNRIMNTSGRLPHAGGENQTKTFIHVVGNYFDSNTQHAIEPNHGAYLLVEGNSYSGMRSLVDSSAKGGQLFLVNSDDQARACVPVFGQRCLLNQYHGTTPVERRDDAVLGQSRAVKADVEAVNDARRAVCIKP